MTHDDNGGLHRDMPQLLDRRQALAFAGGLSVAGLLAACGAERKPTAADPTTPATTSATNGPGKEIPDETGGPFPGDGSNGPNIRGVEGVVRRDIRTSIGDLNGTAPGVETAFAFTVVDASTGKPLKGAAIYAWQATADGRYSMYDMPEQNYLRGIQVADDDGRLRFTSVFPGCYSGRWPHVHFEVYDSLDAATATGSPTKTSQLALPEADCATVYADSRYGDSAGNLSSLALASDSVFADGWQSQLATVSGSVRDGLTASLLVRV